MVVDIDITQEDIDKALQFRKDNPNPLDHSYAENCVLAICFLKYFKYAGVGFTCVNLKSIFSVDFTSDKYGFTLPDNIIQIRSNFDAGIPIQPTSFELEIPDDVYKEIAKNANPILS